MTYPDLSSPTCFAALGPSWNIDHGDRLMQLKLCSSIVKIRRRYEKRNSGRKNVTSGDKVITGESGFLIKAEAMGEKMTSWRR
jgi:hypothetical protein